LRCGSDPAEDHGTIITASMCRKSATACLVKSPSREDRELPGTAVRLASLPDPRARRGRRHSLASVLLTAACAVLAGARSYVAIGQWARHAPQDTLSRLGFHPRGPLGVCRPASASTVRRVLAGVCPGGLADLLGHGPAGTESVSADGKTARGSRTDTAPAARLLSAVTAAGRTVSQLRVPDKTNEITGFTALLAPFDLTGTVVTADALGPSSASLLARQPDDGKDQAVQVPTVGWLAQLWLCHDKHVPAG
ncbi:transposase family protein, partial [Streptomyces sp. NPDC127051]|uniref:transposase family protein n=1 Tax=Streptomyces sp. NPDC127051 TaxID=3347119 RepID=UPI00364E64E7